MTMLAYQLYKVYIVSLYSDPPEDCKCLGDKAQGVQSLLDSKILVDKLLDLRLPPDHSSKTEDNLSTRSVQNCVANLIYP